jgi:hypothetical protein
MLTKEKIAELKKETGDKAKIICLLWASGGLLPVSQISEKLKIPGSKVKHHIRESYYLESKGLIVKLCPVGTDDNRLYSNPDLAPDLSSFVFSLLVKKFDLNHKAAMPFMVKFAYANNCLHNKLLTSENLFYTIKKQVKYYLEAKGRIKN